MIYERDNSAKRDQSNRKGLSSDEDELVESDHSSGFDKKRKPFNVENVDAFDSSSLGQPSDMIVNSGNKAAPTPDKSSSSGKQKNRVKEQKRQSPTLEDDFMKIEVQDPRKKPVDASKITFKHASAESKKGKSLKAGTDEEERETPPDQIITAQKFQKGKHSNSKGSSPYDMDGPSYIDPQTTQHLGDLNLKNQISGINTKNSASEIDSVDEFDSNKKGFNKQIGTKEL